MRVAQAADVRSGMRGPGVRGPGVRALGCAPWDAPSDAPWGALLRPAATL